MYGPEGGELRRRLLERLGRGRERAGPLVAVLLHVAHGHVAQRHLAVGEVDQVVALAGRLDQAAEVGERRPRVLGERAQLGEERAQLLGHGLGVVDQRLEVVERRAQVEERRVGATHEVGQAADRLGERGLLVADRVRGRREVVDQPGEVVAAVREVGDELRGGDDEALEQLRVGVQLAEQARGGRERRVEVQQALVHLLAAALVLRGRALDHLLEVLAGGLVERVEDLVEVDRGRRRLLADDAAVGDLRGLGAGEPQVDVAVGDAGQRRLADRRLRAAPQRRVLLVDAERELGLPVGRQPDLLDRARADARDLHEVALDELRGVLELRLDRVAARGALQQHHDREGSGDGDGHDGRDAYE